MYGALDISASGMIAQRTRLTAISANIANRTSYSADGTPYRGKQVFFSAGDPSAKNADGRRLGVHVSSIEDDPQPFNPTWNPSHPHAIKSGAMAGYVLQSNVNPVMEQINALEAARAYEANAVAAETTKAMYAQALRLLA